MLRPIAVAALVLGAAMPASASDVAVCLHNRSAVATRLNLTVFQGEAEIKREVARSSVPAGDSTCHRAVDVRAMNLMIYGRKDGSWQRVCDLERRPARSLDVILAGAADKLTCKAM